MAFLLEDESLSALIQEYKSELLRKFYIVVNLIAVEENFLSVTDSIGYDLVAMCGLWQGEAFSGKI
jgi:hypothetical protein